MAEFLTDIKTIRDRARAEIEKGPVTDAYGADLQRVLQVCNESLASEIVCVLRYKRHYFTATGIHAEPVAQQFKQHGAEEEQHMNMIAERIVQLGGDPDFNPATASMRAYSEYAASTDLIEMIKEDLVAERIVIEAYTEIIQWLGTADATTRRMFEQILAEEEDHADDLRSLLAQLPNDLKQRVPRTGSA